MSDFGLRIADCGLRRGARGLFDPPSAIRHPQSRAFTLIELLVLLGILVILASIFVPYAMRLREDDRRVRCADHLKQIFFALQAYADANGRHFPAAAPYDPAAPLTVFALAPTTLPTTLPATAPATAPSPAPNSVTASLWLLVRGGFLGAMERYKGQTAVFICPSRGGTAAAADRDRADFPSPDSLGYSYAAPFGGAAEYRLTDTMKSQFALMADLNPGTAHELPRHAPLLEQARINSPNHRRAGQNVLYTYGSVEWQITPYCGMNNDNVYTVRGTRGSTQPTSRPAIDSGDTDPFVLPSAEDDSFLLPAAGGGDGRS